jgi:hypothetical protein
MAEEVAASAVEYRPAAQRLAHAAGRPSAEEKEPAAHEAQIPDAVAPRAVENCPAWHRFVQAAGRPREDE